MRWISFKSGDCNQKKKQRRNHPCAARPCQQMANMMPLTAAHVLHLTAESSVHAVATSSQNHCRGLDTYRDAVQVLDALHNEGYFLGSQTPHHTGFQPFVTPKPLHAQTLFHVMKGKKG